MKKFLIGCATAAMMFSPAIAEAGGRHGHGNDWIAPVIFGTVLGVIISSNSHGHTVRHHRHVRRDVARHHRRNHRRHRWVEVCKRVAQHRRHHHRRHGRYTDYRVECHMVKKAVW